MFSICCDDDGLLVLGDPVGFVDGDLVVSAVGDPILKGDPEGTPVLGVLVGDPEGSIVLVVLVGDPEGSIVLVVLVGDPEGTPVLSTSGTGELDGFVVGGLTEGGLSGTTGYRVGVKVGIFVGVDVGRYVAITGEQL